VQYRKYTREENLTLETPPIATGATMLDRSAKPSSIIETFDH